jgi:hypothetical protein
VSDRIKNLCDALHVEGFAPKFVPSDDPELTDDEIDLAALPNVHLQVERCSHGHVRFSVVSNDGDVFQWHNEGGSAKDALRILKRLRKARYPHLGEADLRNVALSVLYARVGAPYQELASAIPSYLDDAEKGEWR